MNRYRFEILAVNFRLVQLDVNKSQMRITVI